MVRGTGRGDLTLPGAVCICLVLVSLWSRPAPLKLGFFFFAPRGFLRVRVCPPLQPVVPTPFSPGNPPRLPWPFSPIWRDTTSAPRLGLDTGGGGRKVSPVRRGPPSVENHFFSTQETVFLFFGAARVPKPTPSSLPAADRVFFCRPPGPCANTFNPQGVLTTANLCFGHPHTFIPTPTPPFEKTRVARSSIGLPFVFVEIFFWVSWLSGHVVFHPGFWTLYRPSPPAFPRLSDA